MYKKIIWANDGSPTMERVYPVVRELARDSGAVVVLAHVQETMWIGNHPLFADSHRALDSFLQGTVDQLSNDGVDAELVLTETRSGRAAQAVAELAAEVDADLVVAGTHGQGPVAGFFLGGSPLRCCRLRRARCWSCPGVPTTATEWCWRRRFHPERTVDDHHDD